MKTEKIEFQAEVAKVLDIVIHSLYSNHEIFLRELISNASDACDKLRYALLTHPDLAKAESFKITITPDKKANTLTITDNGIGMNKDDLINHLGTIARSGSAEFMKTLTGDKQKDMALIGQFGVGFYASFMVAEKVEVRTKKAGDKTGWLWESTGAGSYTIEEDKNAPQGTAITLFLKKDMLDYLEPIRIRHLVKQYSDHISLPIILIENKKEETINAASAIWTRNKLEWFERRGILEDKIIISENSSEKCFFCKGPQDILLDDFDRNCKEWREAGGTAIKMHNCWYDPGFLGNFK